MPANIQWILNRHEWDTVNEFFDYPLADDTEDATKRPYSVSRTDA